MSILLRFLMAFALLSAGGARFALGGEYPVSISIQAANPSAKAGERVSLDLTLTNISTKTFSLPSVLDPKDGGFYYKIEMADPNGRAVELNDYGQCLYESAKRPDCFRVGSWFGKELNPGDELREVIPLSDIFDMTLSGQYTVQVSRTLPKNLGGLKVVSNPVSVIVSK